MSPREGGERPSTPPAHESRPRVSTASSTSTDYIPEARSPTRKRRDSYGNLASPRPDLTGSPRMASFDRAHPSGSSIESMDSSSAARPPHDTSDDLSELPFTPTTPSKLDELIYVVSRAEPVTTVVDFVGANAGLLLIICSQFFFALMNLGVKLLANLSTPVPTFELIAARMGITAVCCIAWMRWQNVPNALTGPPGIRHLLVLRGVLGFFGMYGLYQSLRVLSLSDATSITFLQSSTISVAGFLLLHEPFKVKELTAGLCALFGVLLIARPDAIFGRASDSDPAVEKGARLGAVGVALLGVLGTTGALITIRHIGTRAHPMHSISYYSVWSVIVAVVGSIALKEAWVLPTNPWWILGLFGIGIAGFLGQVFLTKGLQLETASRGSIGLYTQIIYSTTLERIFLHTHPSALSIIGTCIIMTSAIYIAISKDNQSPPRLSSSTDAEPILPISTPPSARVATRELQGDGRTLTYVPLPGDPGSEGAPVLSAEDSGEEAVPMGPIKSPVPGRVVGADGAVWSPLSPFTPRVPASSRAHLSCNELACTACASTLYG